jgi:hypothetical protein
VDVLSLRTKFLNKVIGSKVTRDRRKLHDMNFNISYLTADIKAI